MGGPKVTNWELLGQKIGRWTVIENAGRDGTKKNAPQWLVQCECGTERVLRHDTLKYGSSLSCGCLQKDLLVKRMTRYTKEEATLNRLYSMHTARKDKWGCLTYENWFKLSKQNCFHCGVEPSARICNAKTDKGLPIRGGLPLEHNGIDRLDSTVGYTLENSVACCEKCNRAKRDYTLDEFLAWAKRLGQYQLSKDLGIKKVD